MEFEVMMKNRRSCRSYQDKAVSREDLVKIVEAGRLTPSGCNSQPWKFIVVDEADAKARLCDALVLENGGCSCAWRETVPAFIVVCEMEANVMPGVVEYFGTTQRFAQGDIGAACMNMCHQAMDLGLGTCILGMYSQKKMEEAFGIPEGHEVRMVIAVGYSAEKEVGSARPRKGAEEVYSFNRW